MPDLDELLKAIASGASVKSDDVIPFISQEELKDRISANFKLAEAYFKARNFEQARIFIRRAWEFSRFAEECLPLFIKIHSALDDIPAIREAHKRLGVKKALERDISGALASFNAWQYADELHRGVDSYQYDFDVLDCIASLAEPYAFQRAVTAPSPDRKVRLAYLMFGTTQTNSVIVKHSLSFARHHDKTRFEVAFFVPEPVSIVFGHREARNTIRTIEELNCGVSIAPSADSEQESLIALGAAIHTFRPDLLITNAALADLKHYFIAAMHPAPMTLALCQGPPPQYVAPLFDWSISWTKHPLIDSPTDCSLVRGGIKLPERQHSTEHAKSFFGIPEDCLVLMSCGRPTKFQDPQFWKAIVDVVRSHRNVWYIVVGIQQPPDFLKALLSFDVSERIRIWGWQKDFLKVLSMADVMIDTYPSGGGVSVVDAMALGIPTVSFKNNYMQTFTQNDWSPAEEFTEIPDLLIERGDFEQLAQTLSRLLTDRSYRLMLSQRCIASIRRTSGDPEGMVKGCEQVYLDVLEKGAKGCTIEMEVASLFPPLPRPPSLLSRTIRRLRRIRNSRSRFLS